MPKVLTLKNLSTFEGAQGIIEDVQYSSKMLITESVSTFVSTFGVRGLFRAPRASLGPKEEEVSLCSLHASERSEQQRRNAYGR